MVKMKPDKKKQINFKKKAIYKIVVDGILSEDYSNRFADMQLKVIREKGQRSSTVLVGEIKDQSALSGILNSLYDMQFTVISVNMLSEMEKL